MKLFNRVKRHIRGRDRKRPAVHLNFELCEERLLLTPFTVNSILDTNTGTGNNGTLRYVISQLDLRGTSTNTIDFNIPGSGVQTISPVLALPPITKPVVINGYTQPGASPNSLANGDNAVLLIELNGANAPAGSAGLSISAGGSTVEGLVINEFVKVADSTSPTGFDGGYGVLLQTNGGNTIQGNFIGTDALGTTGLGNQQDGVLDTGSGNNTIGGTTPAARNVISGNGLDGLDIGNSPDNLIQGNFIGTDATGTVSLGNSQIGVHIVGSSDNTVGGTAAGARNIVSGNVSYGIVLQDSGTTRTIVQGNFIGTDVTGTTALGNGGDGIFIGFSGTNPSSLGNTIGGTTAAARNIISGNQTDGIGIDAPNGGGSGNLILGNFIGTDITGTTALGNVGNGISINDASHNTIGGANTIGFNSDGIEITGSGATGNVVQGNFIGTNVTGKQALGNHFDGIFVSNSPSNTIGGTTAAARNVISGNQRFGIWIFGALSTGNLVQGNFIGTDLTGTANLGNSDDGVLIQQGPVGNTIGGTTTAARNVISGNGGFGVSIGLATSNVVQGNFIGTDVTGAKALGNSRGGVIIQDAASNTIGGATASARNIISGNTGNGITIDGSTATANLLQGNFIGTDVTGTLARGNSGNGMQISSGATNNTIGGTVGGAGNLIAANNANGIYITGSGTSANPVLGNFIGTNASGANLGNGAGVAIDNSAANNTIGGTGAGAGNVISSNSGDGIDISSDGNFVQGNKIGTDVMGSSSLGNQGAGVSISGSNNTIGGTESGAGNVISGNKDYGISVTGGNNSLLNNLIGTNAAGTAALGNGLSGITLQQSAANTIGGNVISGNGVGPSGGDGISLAGASNNAVLGNYIGVGADGTTPLGNVLDGISLNNASSNSIMDNVVSDNGINQDAAGINLEASDLNSIAGNKIGTDMSGNKALGNSLHGIFLGDGSSNNTIGGTGAGARNVISGNGKFPITNRTSSSTLSTKGGVGVYINGANTSGNVVLNNYIGTNVEGTAALPNSVIGVLISQSSGNTVQGNLISGNGFVGLEIAGGTGGTTGGTTASGNLVQSNKIGTNAVGTAAIPNGTAAIPGDGIFINNASNNTIGGTAAGAGNLISGNTFVGIELFGRLTSKNVIQGNKIGTDATGRLTLPNKVGGIFVITPSANQLGGTGPGQANQGQNIPVFGMPGLADPESTSSVAARRRSRPGKAAPTRTRAVVPSSHHPSGPAAHILRHWSPSGAKKRSPHRA